MFTLKTFYCLLHFFISLSGRESQTMKEVSRVFSHWNPVQRHYQITDSSHSRSGNLVWIGQLLVCSISYWVKNEWRYTSTHHSAFMAWTGRTSTLQNPNIHYCVHKIPPLEWHMSQIKSFHISTPHSWKTHFSIIPLSMLLSPKSSLPFRF